MSDFFNSGAVCDFEGVRNDTGRQTLVEQLSEEWCDDVDDGWFVPISCQFQDGKAPMKCCLMLWLQLLFDGRSTGVRLLIKKLQ